MKNVLLACTLFAAATLANAYPMHERGPNAERMQKMLQLDDAQTAKVKKIFDDAQKERSALREKYKPQLEAYHNDMRKQREQTHTQLKSVLTPEQQTKLEAMHEGRRDRMQRAMDCDGDDGDEHKHSQPKSAK